MFIPVEKQRGDKFIIGWVGQKTTGGLNLQESDRIDIKGYNLILKPLMQRLERYPDIKFKIHNKNYKNAIPYSQIPKIYEDIDCQICTSLAEGAPNPMFEAASCGKPLISTRVGAISQCIQEWDNGFLIDAYSKRSDLEKTIDAFEEKILILRNDRDLCDKMGKKSREIVVRDWGWKTTVQKWIPMFEYIKHKKNLQ
jgi:glycosyltransferase involved in cell wall biosynthesis